MFLVHQVLFLDETEKVLLAPFCNELTSTPLGVVNEILKYPLLHQNRAGERQRDERSTATALS